MKTKIRLYYGDRGTGKTSKLVEHYLDMLDRFSSNQIIVLTRNRIQNDNFKFKILSKIKHPIEELNIYRFRSFVHKTIENYWSYIDKTEPLFLSITETILAIEECLKEYPDSFKGAKLDRNLFRRIFDRHQRRAENGLTLESLQNKTKLISEGTLAEQTNEFLIKYTNWLIQKNPPILDYGLQLIYFHRLINIKEVFEKIINKYVCWLIDDIEDAIKIEWEFYEKLWKHVRGIIYTGNPYGGVRKFLGADPDYFFELKDKISDTIELTNNDHIPNKIKDLSKNLYQTIKLDKLPDTRSYDNEIVELKLVKTYSDMLDKVSDILFQLKEQNISQKDILIITYTLDDQMELEFDLIIKKLQWNLEVFRGFKLIQKDPLVNVLLTLLRLVYWQKNNKFKIIPQLQSFEISQMLFILVGFDVFTLSDWRKKCTVEGESELEITFRWLKLMDEMRTRPEFLILGKIKDTIDKCRQNLERNNVSLKEIAFDLWENLIWESSFIKKYQDFSSIQNFFEVLDDYSTKADFFVNHADLKFLNLIIEGAISENPDLTIDFSQNTLKLMTLQKLCEIRIETPYHIWFDITSNNWLRSDYHPIVNPHTISHRWDINKKWNYEIDDKEMREKLAKALRIGIQCCTKKLYLLGCNYDILGDIQTFDLITKFISE